MKIKKQKASRTKYKSISSSERALIIHYIEQYKYSTTHVSMITGHNASTIKAIYSVYKKQGRINKKAKRDKILNLTFRFILFVADDMYIFQQCSQGSLTKLSVDSQESQHLLVEEGQDIKQTSHEQAIKKLLQINKPKIIDLLDNCMAIDTFEKQLKLMQQQEFPSRQFSSLKLSPDSSKWEYGNFAMRNNFNQYSGLFSKKQEDKGEEEESKSIIMRKLQEQYRLMKM
ncbi:unnamed protein product (macronuclear) [Paramecium tetraurelia]|uniref:HTH psq-type domain-containing protein n=1 Tax=Paramecium tetraurelia TaxID=5888 RepID=A0DD13_PARTE|nr:uncharacterized protein GSPATT00015789001 [Paramecium tetraurelia]CAK80930.1 unnamed protein product [Paramecium tetraurelia]|eukprot:XP_001448327.1 hypothetical protein (macronuclear) [Paramecium tetraurelia strain d4-2]